jgi:hypothetical protein
LITNDRGKKNPQGQEDIRFAKLDVMGRVHAIVVGQRDASRTTPRAYPKEKRESATVCVLENFGGLAGFKHQVVRRALSDNKTILMDKKIDPNGRLAARQASIGDRIDIADMDNDGKPDAMVLYQGIVDDPAPGTGTESQLRLLGLPMFPEPIHTYTTGWSYLRNIQGTVPEFWFQDVTATQMLDSSGAYGKAFNRGQGACTIADFNNNGRLDYYTTFARAVDASNGASGGVHGWVVEDTEQLRDFLFMYSTAPSPAGVLTERGALLLPPLVRE